VRINVIHKVTDKVKQGFVILIQKENVADTIGELSINSANTGLNDQHILQHITPLTEALNSHVHVR
jgi:hypothetical protein